MPPKFEFLIFAAFRCLAALSLRSAQVLGAALGTLVYHLNTKRVEVARRNIRACLPALSEKEQESLLKRSMQEIGKWSTECGAVWLWPKEKLLPYITTQNAEAVTTAYAEKKGLLMIVPHIGNWEAVNVYLSHHYHFMAMYKPQKSVAFNDFILNSRSRHSQLVPGDLSGLRKLMRHLKAGGMTAVLPDHQPSSSAGVFAPFFGVPALTGKLAGTLAKTNHSPVFTAVALRKEHGEGYEIIFKRLEGLENKDEVLAATSLNQAVEQSVSLKPEQYQWVYKRFSKTPDGSINIYKQKNN